MPHSRMPLFIIAALAGLTAPAAMAQEVIEGGKVQTGTTIETPPSVDNGIANGDVKHAGAPSVGNGIANGIVKAPGSPSVDNGVANGSAKSTTVNQ